MEFGTLMMMVRHRVHGWQMAMRSQKGLHRGTTTLNINAAGLKRMEDAAFMHHIRKPVDKPHNLNWWHFNFFWGLQGITQSGIGSVPALALTGKISGFNHPAVAHFEFMRNQISGGTVDKQILPAPSCAWQNSNGPIMRAHLIESINQIRKWCMTWPQPTTRS